MRNPRRIKLTDQMIAQHNLSTDPPPPDSLFWTMWNASSQLAEQALLTPFIAGIDAGTLDPVLYGAFNVSDAYYCFNGAPDYQAAANRATDPTVKAFLVAKYQSYQKYNESFTTTWHIQNPACIVPSSACQQYSNYETSIASQYDPIYCIVVMLPCEYLWAWLAAQLAPPSAQNLYAPWINGNNDPSGAYAMGNFLNDNPSGIDEQAAINIYQAAMNYEVQNFLLQP